MKWSWEVRAVEYCRKLGGKSRHLKHYRCGKCHARKSLKRELWEYIRPPKCEYCNVADWRLDFHRWKEYQTKTGVFNTCNCSGGYFFPHRKGGGVWCIHHSTGPTEQDHRDRYG